MSEFRTQDSQVVYDGRVRVRVDTVGTPDGGTVEREIVEGIDSVVVVAVDDAGRVAFVRQHRQATGGEVLELPAGLRDVEGESALDAAARELAEEVGLGGGALVELGTFWVSPGWTTERATLVLATGVGPVPRPEGFTAEGEEAAMDVVHLPVAQALAAASDGTVGAVLPALALLLAAQHGLGAAGEA